VRDGLTVRCVATSEATARQATGAGVPLTDLEDLPELDLTVDGADEIDGQLRLIKGGGGALLREKIVASASRRMFVIADASKCVDRLGAYPLPIEVVPFGLEATRRAIARAAASAGAGGPLRLRLRHDGTTFVTDEGHHILDAEFASIDRPEALAAALDAVPGVVEHGLFIGLASVAFIAGADGVRELKPN
jgi:ribose 5-phosphate isomerase A